MKSLEQKYKHLRQDEIAKTETEESKSSIKLRRINYLEPFTSTSASSQDKGCKYKNKNKIMLFNLFQSYSNIVGGLFGPTFLTLFEVKGGVQHPLTKISFKTLKLASKYPQISNKMIMFACHFKHSTLW